jgi:hypothetical protein
MTAVSLKKSPAELLCADGWWSVFQFLDGNDIAKLLGVSRTLRIMGGKPGVWKHPISTITLPITCPFIPVVQKWRLEGDKIAIDCCKSDENTNPSTFQSVINIIFNNNICPNLQRLALLQLPATTHNICYLVEAMLQRAELGYPLKRLSLELIWFYFLDCKDVLVSGLRAALPEELELIWRPNLAIEKDLNYDYRSAIMDLFRDNESTLKFILPGCIWADYINNGKMCDALDQNETIQSLIFEAPYIIHVWDFTDKASLFPCITKMLVHPSLRYLSIADQNISDNVLMQTNLRICSYTALYFADSECFSTSSIETLHLELGYESPRGLLAVLHSVADMPKLKKFTLSCPTGGQSTPQLVSMERLKEFLKTSKLLGSYKKRIFFGYQDPEEIVLWSTLATLFA